MVDFGQEFLQAQADAVLAADEAGKARLLLELSQLALREQAPGIVIAVGVTLAGRGEWNWGEYALQLALRLPGARGKSLYELAALAARQGRHDRSAMLLEQLEAEFGLDPHQERELAHRLAHLGRFEEANQRLDRSLEMEPESLEICLVMRDYFAYIRKFPREEVLRRAKALLEVYPERTVDEVAEEVLEALRAKRPYSMVRVNDGEGPFLVLSLEDEREFAALYRINREIWSKVIVWDRQMVFDRDWLRVTRDYSRRLANADCIGAHHFYSLEGEYAWGSWRNVPCLFTIVRWLEQMQATGLAEPGRIKLCNPQINQHMLFGGHLERIIRSQTRLGLISAHAALPGALKERFGLAEVVYHQTSGEVMLQAGREREPLAVWHDRICAALEQTEPGMLFLVGAGLFAKIYCDIIKRAGGVALDIGAVADIWMKAPTRDSHALPQVQAFGLVEA
ncbi:MAG: hypothetical protein KY449_03865 [Proteobacteria bacterium]|nr:hypothetical protein [Pseudomonadota bacterium]